MTRTLTKIAACALAVGLAFPAVAADDAKMIEQAAKDAGISKTQAAKALKSYATYIQGALAKGKKVQWSGVGTFSTAKRAARTDTNPQSGDKINVSARTVVRFKADRKLDGALN
jgi:DNA-binding protein HU-beta